MRPFLFAFFLAAAAATPLFAGRLDIAIVQFPEVKTQEDLNQALSTENLYDLTAADRTRSKVSYLKGGTILFAQSLPVSPGGHFKSSTRLQNQCAEVDGSLGSHSISVSIELTEGIKAGLRSLQAKHFAGAGVLPNGAPYVLGLHQSSGKTTEIVKNRLEMHSYSNATAIIAQYTP